MEDSSDLEPPLKKRKARPSRGRGLRTNTGCLTCRKRKLKCDESRPICGQCAKSSRTCNYPSDSNSRICSSNDESNLKAVSLGEDLNNRHSSAVDDTSSILRRPSSQRQVSANIQPILTNAKEAFSETNQFSHQRTFSNESRQSSFPINQQTRPIHTGSDLGISPVAQTILTPGAGSLDWYDLIARDAASNVDNYNFLTSSGSRWSFEPAEALRATRRLNAQSSYASPTAGDFSSLNDSSQQSGPGLTTAFVRPAYEPWSTPRPASLTAIDSHYFQYFIEIIGPMMDLFDSRRHFTNYVPHLALYNSGLLKSMLAVSARHEGLRTVDPNTINRKDTNSGSHEERGTQYYYDTLHYLSQAMKHSSYAKSSEIIATSILISTYEAFGSDNSEDWERHLKGVFWIQRSQDNDGEREGLRQAVWWNWLRQDIWAALRSKRKTLTIWRPKKMLRELNPEELACRVLYLLAKAVKYASDEAINTQDLTERIEEGDSQLTSLREWYEILPLEFKPIPINRVITKGKPFSEVFIHPPVFAAAMQAYASAKILILVNKPSTGGLSAWQAIQKMLDQSVNLICGIVQAPGASDMAPAMVNFQALFVAGQCVRDKEQQEFITLHLKRMTDSCMFPAKNLIHELRQIWARSE